MTYVNDSSGERNPFAVTTYVRDDDILTKVFRLDEAGRLQIDSGQCRMARGKARRVELANLRELATLIEGFRINQALSLGTLRPDLPDEVTIAAEDLLDQEPGAFARNLQNLIFPPGRPAVTLIDTDSKGMPPAVIARLKELGGYQQALRQVVPLLAGAATLTRSSTSSWLKNVDTGVWLRRASSLHLYVIIADGTDNARFLKTLHERCWLWGLGWFLVSSCGSLLPRSIIDSSVGSPERLVFEAPAFAVPPLEQDLGRRRCYLTAGGVLDSLLACPPLTDEERQRLDKLMSAARTAIQPKADAIREAWIDARAPIMAEKRGISIEAARHVLEQEAGGVLLPECELIFVDPEIGTVTVADVLNDPTNFIGKTLADPIEGPSYGRNKAMVLYRDRRLYIKSFAHCGMEYELRDPNAGGFTFDHFLHVRTQSKFMCIPQRKMWNATSVDYELPPVPMVDARGQPLLDEKTGRQKTMPASRWIGKNQAAADITWAPGEPEIINDRICDEGGWVEQPGVKVFNLYRPPSIKPGDPNQAGPWLDLARKVYPDDADHIVKTLAHRVQFPGVKINHALVLVGSPGIGKDSILAPIRRAVGPWNFADQAPKNIVGRFNTFLKSVILRVNEARDLGDTSRYDFYDHMKQIIASPPEAHWIDAKNQQEYYIPNVNFVIITTNYLEEGIYLPPDDRRHYVALSGCTKTDFAADYWPKLWRWYENEAAAT
jgi:hypothetical protein